MIEVTAGDVRRAAALICHHGHHDDAGIDAILQETNESGRVAELLLGVLSVYGNIVPILHSEVGLAAIQTIIANLAAREEQDGHNEERQQEP